MLIESLVLQEVILDQLRKITKDKENDWEEFRKLQSSDSFCGVAYTERCTKELVRQAEDIGIPYPEIILAIVEATPPEIQKMVLLNSFIEGRGRLTEKDVKNIAKELGMTDFNPLDFWERPHGGKI